MSLTMILRANVQIYEDAAKKSARYAPDDTLAAIQTSTFDRQQSGDFAVASAGNEALPLGDISSVRGVLVKVNAACTIRVNGSSDGVVLTPSESGKKAHYLVEGVFTEVRILADQGSAVSGSFCAWGDPAS